MTGVTTADLGDGFSLVRVANVLQGTESSGYPVIQGSYTRVSTRFFVDSTWNSNTFDGNDVVKNLLEVEQMHLFVVLMIPMCGMWASNILMILVVTIKLYIV